MWTEIRHVVVDIWYQLRQRPKSFRHVTGVTPAEFEIIYSELKHAIKRRRNVFQTRSVPPEFEYVQRKRSCRLRPKSRLLLFLWRFRHSRTVHEISTTVGVSPAALEEDFLHIENVIYKEYSDEVKLPDEEERRTLEGKVHNFPHCIYFIDGTCMLIHRPLNKNQSKFYRGDKKTHFWSASCSMSSIAVSSCFERFRFGKEDMCGDFNRFQIAETH